MTDSGARALAHAIETDVHDTPHIRRVTNRKHAPLSKLHTLGLDRNAIGASGLAALADVLTRGALAALRCLLVDWPDDATLVAACRKRSVELSSW